MVKGQVLVIVKEAYRLGHTNKKAICAYAKQQHGVKLDAGTVGNYVRNIENQIDGYELDPQPVITPQQAQKQVIENTPAAPVYTPAIGRDLGADVQLIRKLAKHYGMQTILKIVNAD